MVPTRLTRLGVLAAGLLLAATLASCSGSDKPAATAAPGGECPSTPVTVVVSVDQWGDIVSELGGQCAKVTTLLAGSSVDPHDYEPTPADAAAFSGAQLVVINGGHYDEWAAKLAANSAPKASVITALEAGKSSGEQHNAQAGHAGTQFGHQDGANPHAWYSPSAVTAVADAVSAELTKLAPDAAGYFGQRRSAFTESLQPYHQRIDSIKAGASGKTYTATEGVFDDMATAVGLTNRTPEGYQVASANESDPSPADLDAFLRLLGNHGADVLIYNVQTQGSVPEQIRAAAEAAGVPVVEVTETVPPGTTSFAGWQVDQLDSLAKALGVPA